MTAALEITEQARTSLVRTAERMLRNHEDAEDAAQTALMKAWQHADQFRGECDSIGYLRRCVFNECMIIIRKRRPAVEFIERLFPIESGIFERIYRREEIQNAVLVVQRAVERSERFHQMGLVGPDRMSIFRLMCSGHGQAEIAERMGIPINTVKSVEFRLRAHIRNEAA